MKEVSGDISNAKGWRRVRFLVDQSQIKPGKHRLTEAQSHYLTTVNRLKVGEVVYPFDGLGNEAVAIVAKADGKGCVITVQGPSEFADAKAMVNVHVGQGITSRNRLDVAIEKLTETGVASITAINDFGCGTIDKAGNLEARWSRISSAAAAQCGRMTIPTIGKTSSLAVWTDHLPKDCLRMFLSPTAERRLSEACKGIITGSDVAVVVGRASGLSEQEEQFASDLGYAPVSLGTRILRSETVGVVAMGIILAAAGEY